MNLGSIGGIAAALNPATAFSSALSMGSDAASGILSANYADQLADRNASKAYARSKESYATRYQVTMEDMRKAGLNPMLLATSGFNVSGQPHPAAAQSFPVNVKPPTSSALDVAKTSKTEAETEESGSRTDLNLHKINEVIGNIYLNRKRENLVTAQETLAKAEFERSLRQSIQIEEQIKRVIQEIQNLKQSYQLTSQQTNRERYLTQQTEMLTQKFQAEIEVLKNNMEKLKGEAEIYSSPIGRVFQWIKTVKDSLGLSFVRIGGGKK